jgi:hypothetical protein
MTGDEARFFNAEARRIAKGLGEERRKSALLHTQFRSLRLFALLRASALKHCICIGVAACDVSV